jgi:hypothetical protein
MVARRLLWAISCHIELILSATGELEWFLDTLKGVLGG